MKKILSLFALLVLTVTGAQAQSEYSGIEISFNRSAATEANFTNFTVVVKDLDGNAISGVTAEPVSVAASDNINSAMGGAAAVSWTEKILVGGRFSNNNYNAAAEQNFVLKISGLRTGFAFNKAEVDLYGCNQAGAAVSSNSIAISCAIQTGNAADNLSAFVSSTGNNIDGSQEGGLWHKVTTMKAAAEKTVAANEDLYVKVTIQKTNDSGTKCRPAFRTVRLSLIPMHTVTYQVVDATTGEELASLTKKEEEGATITTFPDELYRNAFYTYTAVPETTVDAPKTITIQATLKDDAPVQFTTDATDPIYYNLNIRSKYLVYNAESTGEVTLQATSEPFTAAASWAFVGTPYDGFKVINKEKGADYHLTYTNVVTGANHGNNNIRFQTTANAGDKVWLIDTNASGFVLRMKENTNIYFHHDNGNNFLRTCSTGEYKPVHDDAGSTLLATTNETALIDLYNALAAVPIGDGLGQYYSTDVFFAGKMADTKDVIDNKVVKYYYQVYLRLQTLQSSLFLNMPKAGQFLRIKSVLEDKAYLKANAAEERMQFSTTADENTIFCFYDNKLVAYKNGVAVNNVCNMGAIGGQASSFVFVEGLNGTMGTYSLYDDSGNITDGSVYLYSRANGENADRGPLSQTGWYNNFTFTLEEVTTLPIKLSEVNGKYYATFSAPVDIANITGATMNNVTVATDNKTASTVEMTATNGLVAGNGVVLIADSYSEGSVVATIGAADENATTNLKAQYISEPAATHNKVGHYFLGTKTNKDGDKVVGFYLLKSDGGRTGGFKAYIEKDETVGAAKEGFDLVFGGEVTGVETIDNGQLTIDNSPVYNLQGQKVTKAQKGVYIQNGRKVVLK
ncbi:MAG: hypothetical protein IKT22_03190 [Prevotella sp.]|nr:hypothetical protein [Prevotella sp.]